MFVRVLIEQGRDPDAIVVPPQAIQRNSSGASEVYLVKDDNRIVAQPVRTGGLIDGQWLITEGLKPGQRVVVEGFQKFAVGDAVRASNWRVSEQTGHPLDKSAAANVPAQSQVR
jgi:membrane fusion protein (multidrug efflux system)